MADLRLLAATDLSARSAPALRRTAHLSRQLSADFHILHVVDEDQPRDMVASACRMAEEELAREVGELEEVAGRPPTLLVQPGEPFQTIVDRAEELDASLVVLGAHRKLFLRDVFVGTTLERVIRTGSRPVLMVNGSPSGPYGRVLVATDMSPASANALQTAASLDLLAGVDVTLLHAFQVPAKASLIEAHLPAPEIDAHVGRQAAAARSSLIEFLSGLGLGEAGHTVRLEEGDPIERIVEAAERDRPDLVVIGTRGLTGLKRVLLGSVADALLRRLECDVLAVGPRTSA